MTDIHLYDIGDNVTMSAKFTSNNVDADPTAVRFKLKTPNGDVTTYNFGVDLELIKDSIGDYHVCYTTLAHGTYHYRFEGTGAVVAAAEGSFAVRQTNFS